MSNCKNTQKSACGQKKNTCGQQKEETHSCNCQCQHEIPCNKGTHMDMGVCGHSSKLYPMLQTYTTKVLQPTMCCGKKVLLTQQMMACEDYKYVIRWDFDLGGKTILVPENCILEFDGGTLRNGTIIGQDTYINDVGGLGVDILFGEGITRKGTWRMNEGGGSTPITVDSELSDTSTNPVQNKIIKGALDNKQDTLNSGQNIKTINGESILGGGNIQIEGGGSFEQVQSDWNETNPQSKAFIKNKPADVGTKVQSDWNQEDSTKPDYIKNKPTIPEGGVVDDHLSETSTNPVQNKTVTKAISENRTGVSSVNSTLLQLVERVATDESAAAASKVALEAGLQTEKTQRETSDTTVNARIAAEEEARAQKDASIDDDITALRAGLGNVYNKTEVNNLISNTPESDVVVVQGQEGVDPITLLPATGAANKLYRIMSETGDSFSEYGWNGSAYVLLANKNTGVDNKPTLNSNKLITSDAIAKNNGLCVLRNGTLPNPGNANGVATWFAPCKGLKVVKIETDRPNRENCSYLYGFVVVSSEDLIYTTEYVSSGDSRVILNQDFSRAGLYTNIADISKYDTAAGIAFSIVEINQTTNEYSALRIEDFSNYQVKIVDADEEFHNIKVNRLCHLANGSSGNPSNNKAVNTWFVPVDNAKEVYFETDRPNANGCVYRIGWYTLLTSLKDYKYVNVNDATQIEPSLVGPTIDYSFYNPQTSLSLDLYDGIKSVSCVIAEYNKTSNTYNVLRVSDFKGYNVKILKTADAVKLLNRGKNDVKIRNGSIGNPTSDKAITTECVRIGSNKYVTIETNRPNKSNCEYRYGWALTSEEKDIHSLEPNRDVHYADYSRYSAENIVIVSNYPEAVGISFIIAEWNLLTESWETLKEDDFEKYWVKVSFKEEIETAFNYLINGDSIVKCSLRNGSGGNVFNANAVSTFLIPTLNYSDFEVRTTRPNPVGYHYLYDASFSTNPSGDTSNASNMSNTKIEYTDNQLVKTSKFSRHYNESRGVQLTIWERSDADNSYHPLRISDFEGYDVYVIRSGVFDSSNIVTQNQHKLPLLMAACRYRKNSENDKELQIAIVTDTHNDIPVTKRAIDGTNGIPTIDALIHCGDVVASYMHPEEDVSNLWKNIVGKSRKPFYFVIGNHEAGNFAPVMSNVSDEELYNAFIKPSVDAGHLLAGEYTLNKCYYYHDFKDYKKRLIVLDEYETPLIFDTTDWTPITYNSQLPTIAWNTTYQSGAEVNDFYYKGRSFRATHAVTTPANFYDGVNTLPRYKYVKGARWISQEQAQWFLNTLLSTPSDFGVIVACHAPFSENAGVIQTSKFSQKGIYEDGYSNLPSHMVNDFIADAINAFQAGTNFSTVCTSKYPNDIAGYSVSADFSRKNSGAKFLSLIGGHTHKDFVWKHNVYNQIDITPICSNSNYPPQCPDADIRRANSVQSNNSDVDSLTIVTYRENDIVLVKLGVDVTEDFEKRDYEIINIGQ